VRQQGGIWAFRACLVYVWVLFAIWVIAGVIVLTVHALEVVFALLTPR